MVLPSDSVMKLTPMARVSVFHREGDKKTATASAIAVCVFLIEFVIYLIWISYPVRTRNC